MNLNDINHECVARKTGFSFIDNMTEEQRINFLKQQKEIEYIASCIDNNPKDKLMNKKTLKELADQVDTQNKIEELKNMELNPSGCIFALSQKIYDMKFQKAWTNRNTNNAAVLLMSLEVECKWFHSDIFITRTSELELKLKRIGFEEINPKTDSSKVLKNLGIILYNKKYNIAIYLIEEKYMSILDLSLTIVKGSSSGFHTDMAVFISSLTTLSKTL